MRLGPTYETAFNRVTGEPGFGYAREMIALAGDVRGKRVLIIGGAGHSQAHALELRGAVVTEAEIDPLVVEASDAHFGPIEGTVVVGDGRAVVQRAAPESFDAVLIDAYNGPASVPAQLTTVEFFAAVRRALAADGRMLLNFIGSGR
jgi:spermidine synthase